MGSIEIREIAETDYEIGFMQCLSELTKVGDVDYSAFKERLSLIKSKGDYKVLVAVLDKRVVGTGTLFIEYKFIRGLSLKGHIEDVVVVKDFQRHGLGKKIVQALVEASVERGCYKTALCTEESNTAFYEKCGFTEKEKEMVIYHKESLETPEKSSKKSLLNSWT